MAISIRLDDDLNNRVQHLATRRQRSPRWLMREAIKQYVEREEARESFTAEALASWAAYQETGQHLTGQEVRVERRFAQLATAPDIGRPFPENQEFRELAIRFGDFGYVAPYRHDPADEAVYVRAFKHQREAGY